MTRWFEHTVTDITRAPSDSGCRQQTRHANSCVGVDPLRERPSSVRKTEKDRTLLMSLFEQGPQICVAEPAASLASCTAKVA